MICCSWSSLASSVHQNYVGADAEKNPFFLSVVLTDANSQGTQQYRAILWRKTVSINVAGLCPTCIYMYMYIYDMDIHYIHITFELITIKTLPIMQSMSFFLNERPY